MTDHDALIALAKAASPGPWYDAGCWTVHNALHEEVAHPVNHPDIAYIAAISPDVVLSLLDRIERVEAENKALREELERLRPKRVELPPSEWDDAALEGKP